MRMIRKFGVQVSRFYPSALAVVGTLAVAGSALAQGEDPYELPDIGFDGAAIVAAYGATLGGLLAAVVGLGLVIYGAWRLLKWTRRATA